MQCTVHLTKEQLQALPTPAHFATMCIEDMRLHLGLGVERYGVPTEQLADDQVDAVVSTRRRLISCGKVLYQRGQDGYTGLVIVEGHIVSWVNLQAAMHRYHSRYVM